MDIKKIFTPIFIIIETIILLLAAFFHFALIGYITTVLCLLALGAVLAAFQILHVLGTKTALILRNILIVILCLGTLLFIVAEGCVIAGSVTDEDNEKPYIIVLGAGVNGTVPSLSLYERIDAALEYLQKYPDSKAVLSGGQGPGEDITEAECMRRFLTERGIDESRLIIEDTSTSTEENISFSLDKIAEDGGDRTGEIAIVTADYHLYRAKYILENSGAVPFGVAAETSKLSLKLNYFIREAFAVVEMWIT